MTWAAGIISAVFVAALGWLMLQAYLHLRAGGAVDFKNKNIDTENPAQAGKEETS